MKNQVKQPLAEMVKDAGFQSVKELASLLNVTDATIRNWTAEKLKKQIVYGQLQKILNKNGQKARIILALLSEEK